MLIVGLIVGCVFIYDFLQKLFLKNPSADVIGSIQGEKMVGSF